MEETKDVTETPSAPTALETAIASSPEVEQQAQEAQTPTAEKGETQEQAPETQEEGRIPYSRFKEVNDEKAWYKQQLEQMLQTRPQVQPQQPTTDPYAGYTPEEERFWRAVDDRARKIAQGELANVKPIIDAGRMELAQIKVQEFRRNHPDIKANSPEEYDIAQRINAGYTPDDAYWSIMGPRGIKVAQTQVKQQVKQQIEAKKKANVETSSSVPVQSQPAPKRSFREEMLANLEKAERGEL